MKKTKNEVIIEAWRAVGFTIPDKIQPGCFIHGWLFGIFTNGVDSILQDYPNVSIEDIDYDIEHSGVGKFRPKTLRGIENNNGWIKVGSDISSYKGPVWGITKDGIKLVFDDASYITEGLITHYQPYVEPENLLFDEED